jgi:hypothetical protein
LTNGTVSLIKTDDSSPTAGNALVGVGFTLYNDLAPAGGVVGTYESGTDTVAKAQQLTLAGGALTFQSVTPEKNYCIVETLGKGSDYGTAAPVCFFFPKSTSASPPSYTVPNNILNPRKHKVVVFVCHQGTNSLTTADVTIDGVKKGTLTTLPSGLDAATLCGLTTGASFSGYDHVTKSASIEIKP